jgi:RHS repeat-associated protein
MTSKVGSGTTNWYAYGSDVHGSTSTLLLEGATTPKATYGYTAYGAADNETTAGDYDPSNPSEANTNNPLNPYRYTARRLDTGAADGLDMGARRYSPDAARFLQVDYFNGALADLALSSDPLTSNRYGLAGGNPLSFIEWDGHMPVPSGDLGGVGEVPPQTPPPSLESEAAAKEAEFIARWCAVDCTTRTDPISDLHAGLDFLGFAPGFGLVPDLVNAGIMPFRETGATPACRRLRPCRSLAMPWRESGWASGTATRCSVRRPTSAMMRSA